MAHQQSRQEYLNQLVTDNQKLATEVDQEMRRENREKVEKTATPRRNQSLGCQTAIAKYLS